MNRAIVRGLRQFILWGALVFLGTALIGQDNASFLAQKLMLENTLRERISDGLSKVLNDEKFVVDIQAEIEFQPSQRTETVYKPRKKEESGTAQNSQSREPQQETRGGMESSQAEEQEQMPGMILPGIPSDVSFERPTVERQPEQPEQATQDTAAVKDVAETDLEPEVVSHSVAHESISLPRIKRLSISVILENGISPELLENARQVVKVASHFDRTRGDQLSMMTASFKKAAVTEDGMAEDEVLLQNIAATVEEIQKKQDQAERERLIEEQRQREQMLLRRDSLRLKQLNDELEGLRGQIQTQQERQPSVQDTGRRTQLEDQRAQVQATIEELKRNIAARDSALVAMQQGTSWNPWLVGAGLLVILLILAGIIWLATRSLRKEQSETEEELRQELIAQRQQMEEKAASAEKKETPSPRPTSADKEDVQSVRQTVVSMSVGQPDTANSILNNWLTEEEYYPEESEPPSDELE